MPLRSWSSHLVLPIPKPSLPPLARSGLVMIELIISSLQVETRAGRWRWTRPWSATTPTGQVLYRPQVPRMCLGWWMRRLWGRA